MKVTKTLRIRDAANTQIVIPGDIGWVVQYVIPHDIQGFSTVCLRDQLGQPLQLNVKMEPFALWDVIVRQTGDVKNELD